MSDALINAVNDVGVAIYAAGWLLTVFRRPADGGVNSLGLIMAIVGTITMGVSAVMGHNTLNAAIAAAYTAWWIWKWWNNGGGTKLRKRLTSLRRRFVVGRVTQPQGA
jgi:hypothetical protein